MKYVSNDEIRNLYIGIQGYISKPILFCSLGTR